MSTTTKTTTSSTEERTDQDARFGFECLRNIRDGKVDLAGVGNALGYKNVHSVANRFRAMRSKYGFTGLECTTGSSPAKNKSAAKGTGAAKENGDNDDEAEPETPTKRGPGRPAARKPRKGAKVSTDKPIPATGPVVKKEEEDGDEEAEEEHTAGLGVEVKNEETA